MNAFEIDHLFNVNANGSADTVDYIRFSYKISESQKNTKSHGAIAEIKVLKEAAKPFSK